MMPLYRFLVPIGKLLMYGIFRLKVTGAENLKRMEGKCVIICNHIIWLDCITVAAVDTKRQVRYLSKHETFENKLAAFFLYKLGAYPIKRGQADIAAIKKSLTLLREGETLGIFPEGTRSGDAQNFNEFQKGAAAIAIKAGAPVVPMYIAGYKIFRRSRVFVGEALDLSGMTSEQGTEVILQAISKLKLAVN